MVAVRPRWTGGRTLSSMPPSPETTSRSSLTTDHTCRSAKRTRPGSARSGPAAESPVRRSPSPG